MGVVPYISVAHFSQPMEQPCDHQRQDCPSPSPSLPPRSPRSHPSFGPCGPPFPLLQVQASMGLFPPRNSGKMRSMAFRGVGMYKAPCPCTRLIINPKMKINILKTKPYLFQSEHSFIERSTLCGIPFTKLQNETLSFRVQKLPPENGHIMISGRVH